MGRDGQDLLYTLHHIYDPLLEMKKACKSLALGPTTGLTLHNEMS